jgi:hypothetical protein
VRGPPRPSWLILADVQWLVDFVDVATSPPALQLHPQALFLSVAPPPIDTYCFLLGDDGGELWLPLCSCIGAPRGPLPDGSSFRGSTALVIGLGAGTKECPHITFPHLRLLLEENMTFHVFFPFLKSGLAFLHQSSKCWLSLLVYPRRRVGHLGILTH